MSDESAPTEKSSSRPDRSRSSRGRKGGGQSGGQDRSTSRKGQREAPPLLSNISFEELQRCFAACGRCGYFLTGYRVIHGLEALREAAAAAENNWVTLTWDLPTRELIKKSFGVRTDIEFYYLDHACTDCQRHLIYDQGEEEAPADTFRISLL